jgi:hypothetical protein
MLIPSLHSKDERRAASPEPPVAGCVSICQIVIRLKYGDNLAVEPAPLSDRSWGVLRRRSPWCWAAVTVASARRHRRPTFSETKRIVRTLLSIYQPSAATLQQLAAAKQPQQKPSTAASPAAAAPAGGTAGKATAAAAMPQAAAEPQIEASKLHRAAAAGDADKVRQALVFDAGCFSTTFSMSMKGRPCSGFSAMRLMLVPFTFQSSSNVSNWYPHNLGNRLTHESLCMVVMLHCADKLSGLRWARCWTMATIRRCMTRAGARPTAWRMTKLSAMPSGGACGVFPASFTLRSRLPVAGHQPLQSVSPRGCITKPNPQSQNLCCGICLGCLSGSQHHAPISICRRAVHASTRDAIVTAVLTWVSSADLAH